MSTAQDGIVPDTEDGNSVLEGRRPARPSIRSKGDEVTVETIGSPLRHDVVHHLHDLGAG